MKNKIYSDSYFVKVHDDARIPKIAEEGSIGYDLYLLEDTYVAPFSVICARSGIVAKPPDGFHYEILIRSSIPIKNPGISLANGVGLIDPSFCGEKDEIKVALYNGHPLETRTFKKGTRVAQLVLRESFTLYKSSTKEKKNIKDASRGGFGSTDEN